MFIKNSEPNGIVDSQTLSHSANKVIFLKSALNHIYLSSSSLFWIESYHWYWLSRVFTVDNKAFIFHDVDHLS